MRILISGASGFVGTHLAQRLLEERWSIRLLRHVSKVDEEEKFEIVRGDVLDLESILKACHGVDLIFHLAAALGSPTRKRKEFSRINVEGTQNLLQAALKARVKRVIHVSSAGVLGEVERGKIATEDFPLKPKSIYDKTKLEGERIALRAAKEGMDVIVLRPGWVYGPGDKRTFKLIRAIAEKKFILLTKGDICQTPVFIADLVEGILLSAKRGKSGEIYNLAGKEVLSIEKIVKTIAAKTGSKVYRLPVPLPLLKAFAWSLGKSFSLLNKEAPLSMERLAFFIYPKPLCIQKASEELCYSPEFNFEKGMEKAIAWYKKEGWL